MYHSFIVKPFSALLVQCSTQIIQILGALPVAEIRWHDDILINSDSLQTNYYCFNATKKEKNNF